MKKAVLMTLVVMALMVSPAWAASGQEKQALKTPFTSLVAFGDSFSDNAFADGHGFARATNTWTWVEYLAQMLGLADAHDNWAWGGAMSDERNCNLPDMKWSGLQWQIDEYLKTVGQADLSKNLFTIMCGSNDIWVSDPIPPAQSAKNIRLAMTRLARAGARHILYRETSAVIMSPGYLAGQYAEYHDPWAKAVNEMNAATKKEILEGFAKEFPEVKVYYLETDPLFAKIKNGEPGFKFEIFDKPWRGTYTFPEPYKYMWYDDWHPMGQVHKLMAEDAVEGLKESLK